jgi:hypothetical protein
LLSTPALAEPSAADRATARSLAREGFEALKKDDFETAEDRFRRADELVHAPTLVVDHARALVGLGRLVEAHERYSLVLREGVSPNAAWPWKRAHADAQKEIELIKQRLAWLTIQVTGPKAPEVTLDGQTIPQAAIGVRRATDPGERSITIGGAGFHPKTQTLTLAEGEEKTLEVTLDPMPEEAVQEEPAPEQPLLAPQEVTGSETGATDNDTLAYVALGVGGAGLATWGVTGVLFLRQKSALSESCINDTCTEDDRDGVENYQRLGAISAVAFGVGVAGAAVGVTLLLMDPTTEQTAAQKSKVARVSPYFSGNSLGIVGQF